MVCEGGAGAGKKRRRGLAEYLLNDGPQPPEGLLSDVCEAFTCTPDIARQQDYDTVMQILEYRMAREAVRAEQAGRLEESGLQPFYAELANALLEGH